MSDGQVYIGISRERDKRAFERAKREVADTLDADPEDVSQVAVMRELAEAYTGGDSLGRWRE
jgi:hypothetical protein